MIGERLWLAAQVLAFGVPKEPEPVVGARMWGHIPRENPLAQELRAAQQRSAALSLLDEEVYSYAIVTVRRQGTAADVRVVADVEPEFWPAINETLRRVIAASRSAL